MASSMQPELKGVVIISLPPPNNPSEGKTVCAAFTVRDPSVQQQQQHHQEDLSFQRRQVPSSNPRRPIFNGKVVSFRKVSAFLLAAALALAIWQWAPNYSEFDRSKEDEGKPAVYILHPKYGVNYHGPVEGNPALRLGVFVERDEVRNRIKDDKASPVSSTNSSTIFPIRGNVYPDGLYYVSMLFGNPPRPYHLDVDTGSDLTWLQCDAPCTSCSKGPHPLYKPVRGQLVSCKDSMCADVQAGHNSECTSASQQCDYEIVYADHGSSMGVLTRDAVRVLLTNGSIVKTNFVFGCAYDQQGSLALSPAATDGVLGLSSAKVSFPSQLAKRGLIKNVFGHCIGGDERGGGYMFFGEDLVPMWGMTWVPMRGKPSMKLYHVGTAKMNFGNRPLHINGMESSLGGVVFDSGSSFTYLTHQAYIAFVSAVKETLFEKPLEQDLSDSTLPLCWRGHYPFRHVS
eukprot:Gb_39151 [translate_table: standard]